VDYLLRQAAYDDQPVIDAGLWLGPGGTGVLCVFTDTASQDASQPTLAAAGTLTRGVRLRPADLSRVEPLGLPLGEGQHDRREDLPARVAIQGVLWAGGLAGETPRPAAALDVLGALLPHIRSASGAPLAADAVTALSEWLAGCDCLAVGSLESAAAADWLAAVGEPARVAGHSRAAVANG